LAEFARTCASRLAHTHSVHSAQALKIYGMMDGSLHNDMAIGVDIVGENFNSTADALANDGKSMDDLSVQIDVAPMPSHIAAVRGFWDGAHSSDAESVEGGWWIMAAAEIGFDGEPVWLQPPLLRARGKARGHNAIIAELIAFSSLVESIEALTHGKLGPHKLLDSTPHSMTFPHWS